LNLIGKKYKHPLSKTFCIISPIQLLL
jgi:hypothetical protein